MVRKIVVVKLVEVEHKLVEVKGKLVEVESKLVVVVVVVVHDVKNANDEMRLTARTNRLTASF